MYTLNVKNNHPPADVAVGLILSEIDTLKFGGIKILKVIHGYGSSGVGGLIKSECHKSLNTLKKQGKIQDYIKGENFSINHKKYEHIKSLCQDIIIDVDTSYPNPGITIILI